MAANRLFTPLGRLLLVACLTMTGLLASESHGTVKSGGLPVPGATVTAMPADKALKKVVTTTDDEGFYSFPELEDGTWTISVEALGFVTASREVGVVAGAPGPTWDLKYQTLDLIEHPVAPETPAPASATPSAPAAGTTGAAGATTPATTPATTAGTPATTTAPPT